MQKEETNIFHSNYFRSFADVFVYSNERFKEKNARQDSCDIAISKAPGALR
jgi:hypothetical protein